MIDLPLYAVFKDGKQVSKFHTSLDSSATEAFEIGVIVHSGGGRALVGGYEIRRVDNVSTKSRS